MIATWMLYCLLCAVGLAAAALLAERALLAGGAPVRHVWVIATAPPTIDTLPREKRPSISC